MWKFYTQSDGVRRWGLGRWLGHEGRTLRNGISALVLGFLFCFVLFLLFFPHTAYGCSQARGQFGAAASGLHHSHQQPGIWIASMTYTTGHRQPWTHLTHWATSWKEPVSSWVLVWFITAEPWWKLWIGALIKGPKEFLFSHVTAPNYSQNRDSFFFLFKYADSSLGNNMEIKSPSVSVGF